MDARSRKLAAIMPASSPSRIPRILEFFVLKQNGIIMSGKIEVKLANLLAMDPIKGIEHCQRFHARIEKSYGAIVRDTLVFAKEFVVKLWMSEQRLECFFNHPFWQEKPYRPDPARLPLLALQFILGAPKAEGALYEKARSYAKIVEYYLEKNCTAQAML